MWPPRRARPSRGSTRYHRGLHSAPPAIQMAVLPWIRSSRRTGDGELRLQVPGRNTRNSSVTFLDVASRSVLLIVAVTFQNHGERKLSTSTWYSFRVLGQIS